MSLIARRQFLHDCGIGLGKVALASLLAGCMTATERSWWLVFTSFFLFISVGANLYLGWTVMEFYSRYKLAVERLRTSSSRG